MFSSIEGSLLAMIVLAIVLCFGFIGHSKSTISPIVNLGKEMLKTITHLATGQNKEQPEHNGDDK